MLQFSGKKTMAKGKGFAKDLNLRPIFTEKTGLATPHLKSLTIISLFHLSFLKDRVDL